MDDFPGKMAEGRALGSNALWVAVRVLSEIELDLTWSLRLQGDAEFAGNYGSLAGTTRIAARW